MTGVLNNQSDIVFLGKFNTSCDVGRLGCVDTVDGRATQIAHWASSYRAIDRSTGVNNGICESNWRCFPEESILVDFADLLTLRGILAKAIVTGFGEGFVGD